MTDDTGEKRHTAGAFDVRTFIGALIGIFGLVLILAGIFGPDETADSVTDGSTINLWSGAGLIVFAVLMLAWARLRPTIVDEVELARDKAHADDDPGQ